LDPFFILILTKLYDCPIYLIENRLGLDFGVGIIVFLLGLVILNDFI